MLTNNYQIIIPELFHIQFDYGTGVGIRQAGIFTWNRSANHFSMFLIQVLDKYRIFSIIINMSTYDFEPDSNVTLEEDYQIRAFVHPTRMVILEILASDKDSVSGLARKLNTHPANLTHHVKLLEKTGLIKLVEKRETGKNLEKLYRATAYHYSVAPTQSKPQAKGTLALGILRDNLTNAIRYQQSLQEDDQEAPLVIGSLNVLQLSQEDLQEFIGKMTELVDTYSNRSSSDEIPYCLNISLYPNESHTSTGQEVYIQENK
jgi:DNA-binding transcriptional ArsR family regulator